MIRFEDPTISHIASTQCPICSKLIFILWNGLYVHDVVDVCNCSAKPHIIRYLDFIGTEAISLQKIKIPIRNFCLGLFYVI